MSQPSINITNASLSYHQHQLFTELNVTFPAGQWSSLLGPSGVGKSSLLRLIANLSTGGQLSQQTKITATNQQPLQQQISYLGQQNSLMPWLNSLENVLIGYRLRNQSIKTHKPKAIELLKQVGLGNAINKRPNQLSGGMQQRVALIRTLIEDKPIILMDEPFSALDVVTRLTLQELACNLLKGKTVILVTHDPLEALRLSDNIYIMAGTPAKLSEPIQPKSATPREASDPLVLELQGKLLIQLQHAYEASQ